jgi:hypothetical protein
MWSCKKFNTDSTNLVYKMLVRLNQVDIERALEKKSITVKSNTRDMVFYPVVRPISTPCCGDLLRSRIALNPSQVIQWSTLSTTVFFLSNLFPFARNLHKLELLALTMFDHKKGTRVREEKQHTQDSIHNKCMHTSQDVSTKHDAGSSQLNWCSNL